MATAIHREHFLVTMLKKEIFTAKELDLRPLGKVIIFRVKQNLPIIYRLQTKATRDQKSQNHVRFSFEALDI